MKDIGATCLFAGYTLDHDGDCYRMYNPQTNRVIVTRDIVWMQRMFYQGSTPPHADENLNEEGPMFVLDGAAATTLEIEDDELPTSSDELVLVGDVLGSGFATTNGLYLPVYTTYFNLNNNLKPQFTFNDTSSNDQVLSFTK